MKILYGCAWWGLDHLGIEAMLETIAAWGYDVVETGIPEKKSEQALLQKALKDSGLRLVAHQYQAEGDSPETYIKSLKKWIEISASFKPILINSHTGHDYWDFSKNSKVVEACMNLEQDLGVTIAHETHRGRFLYSAPASRPYFEEFPEMKITADLSHWVCVSESLLEHHGTALNEAISRAEHIHARVGHEQGSQISHPQAPEWEGQIEAHLTWWEAIVKKKTDEGQKEFVIVPEFGPAPYMGKVPFSTDFYGKHTDMNLMMMDILKKRLQ